MIRKNIMRPSARRELFRRGALTSLASPLIHGCNRYRGVQMDEFQQHDR
ncbi:hypothetical protein A2U01_0119193, partial [Trifolium medium]|nr:hypothetical protein [Trifolium medium]